MGAIFLYIRKLTAVTAMPLTKVKGILKIISACHKLFIPLYIALYAAIMPSIGIMAVYTGYTMSSLEKTLMTAIDNAPASAPIKAPFLVLFFL